MPAIGKVRADISGEPVSIFNLTDEEDEMHNRVWRFLVAPHAEDWFMDTVAELRRARIVGKGVRFEPSRYYRWLHQEDYASSRVRYATIADHARSDSGTAPTTFAAICRVLEIDRHRAVASEELHGLSASEVEKRRAENHQFIGWFTLSLRYRYDAYSYALDHLLVETPHREAVEVDRQLGELYLYVERAEQGDFCSAGVSFGETRGKALPSRIELQKDSVGTYRK